MFQSLVGASRNACRARQFLLGQLLGDPCGFEFLEKENCFFHASIMAQIDGKINSSAVSGVIMNTFLGQFHRNKACIRTSVVVNYNTRSAHATSDMSSGEAAKAAMPQEYTLMNTLKKITLIGLLGTLSECQGLSASASHFPAARSSFTPPVVVAEGDDGVTISRLPSPVLPLFAVERD